MQSSFDEMFETVYTPAEKAALRGEVFSHCELVGIDLGGADLRGAQFQGTSLTRCNLRGADLRGARFVLCDLTAVVVTGAVFGDNRFDGSTFTEMVGISREDRALIEKHGGTFLPPHASRR